MINQLLPWTKKIKAMWLLPLAALILAAPIVNADTAKLKKAYAKVFEGYKKVVSTADGKKSLFTIWQDEENAQMLAELPKDFAKKKFFFALTVSSGERFAGLQYDELYVYWKKFGDRLALIEPNVETRSTGDNESKRSVKRIFTDRVIADLPILALSPKGEPVIDMDEFLVKQATKFFGVSSFGGPPLAGADYNQMYRLREITKAKAFPKNVEIAFRVPVRKGQLKTLHYSISEIPASKGYKTRKADDRVGYFTTAFDDLGKYKRGETRVRYINRWHLEKADPSLKLSPPKKPIVFYVEHTAPIRYRRFIRQGTLYWNNAFEKVGLVGAIEVYFQDATTGAHMEKDPEDVRYNFIRWLNNNISTAIGPSRVNPLTGEILDADIILTDGWIRVFDSQFNELLPKLAMQGFSPETMVWLERNPTWDPRFLLASPQKRNLILAARAQRGVQPLGGHALGKVGSRQLGDDPFDGLANRTSQVNGMCMAAMGKAFDLAVLRMTMDLLDAQDGGNAQDEKLDGIPSRFIGPLLADLVAHEVGHTLGLRHNFKASSIYTLKEINSKKIKGKKPFTSSVMDYNPININMKDGEIQGDYAMIHIGPYDMWAIEYGYCFDEKELPKILSRCTEKELQYLTDQDTAGPDPFARRYDFTADPIDYAKNQMKLANYHRSRLLNKFVKDGESWAKARRGYEMTLRLHVRSLSMMSNWIGGAYIRREHKGDGNRPPIEAVPAAKQREALKWVMENAFEDEVFGLNRELLQRLRTDFLQADESFRNYEESTFPVHDRIMGIQSSVLTLLMNPTTLRRVYDNELMVDPKVDALTLPEMLDSLKQSIWRELEKKPNGNFTARKPMISSLRRNLQREYIERLIDLTHPSRGNPAATKPISTLALAQLRQLSTKIAEVIKSGKGKLDPYTLAHLEDSQTRVTKALEARYVIDPRSNLGGGFFFQTSPTTLHCNQQGCVHCRNVRSGSWNRE